MIILTGGAGFIGSCFLKKLNDEGYNDILVVDRLGEADKWKNLVGKRFIDVMHRDVFREQMRKNALSEEIDAVVHFGACSATTEKNADYLLDNNYVFSKEIAEFALNRDAKFIYASSAATYGMGENGYSDKCESIKLKPLNMYGYSKLLFDLWIEEQDLLDKVTGIKFFNVFGPNEYHKSKMTSMVYKAFAQINETNKIKLFKSNSPEYKDGEQMRDFVYIKDVIEVLYFIFENNINAGILNIGAGKAQSWNELATAVFMALDKKVDIEYIDMPQDLSRQYQNFTLADLSKLRSNQIDYDFMPLNDSVKDYVKNHLLNHWQYF